MTTPTTPAADLTDRTAPDPTAPNTRALRVLALCGFLLLVGCPVLAAVLGLVDAVEGDGVGGGFLTAGFLAPALGAVAGAAALAAPRRALVAAQYALALAAPVLAALDRAARYDASSSSASTIRYAYPCSARNRCRCAAKSWSMVSRATTE